MSVKIHRVLNRILPASVRSAGRNLAVAMIPSMRHLDMPCRLRHLRHVGIKPTVILDIGSASGEWARMANGIWPEAKIFGFEPNAREVPALETTKQELGVFEYFRCFLGPEAKVVNYVDSKTQTSLFAEVQPDATDQASMRVLDQMLAEGQILQPQLIKLDVQGFELEVLKGATRLMERVEVAIMEISFAPFHSGMPIVNDVVAFMQARGFVWYDIISALRRPKDDRLMQIDAIFVREGNPLLDSRWE